MDGPGFFVDDIYIKLETDIDDKKNGIIHTAYPHFDFPVFIKKEEKEPEKFFKNSYKFFNKSILMNLQLMNQNVCSFKSKWEYLNLPPILHKKCKDRYIELIHEMKSKLEGVNLQMMDLSNCDQRKKAFSQKLGKIKQATRKNYRKYKLKDCYVKLERLQALKSENIKPKKCPKCDKIFRQNTEYTSHIQLHNQEKIYKCSHCDKKFSNISQWKNHEMVHTISDSFSCEYCNKSFTMRKYLHAHLKWHHSDKFFRCTSCEKKFRSFQHLKVHLRSHSMEKPFECGKCYKTFSCSSVLRNHEKIHSGLNEFVCNVCNKNFSTSFSLSRHMNLHLGTKSHQCRHCDKSFHSLNNFMMHIKVHEKEKILAGYKENGKVDNKLAKWGKAKHLKKEKNNLAKPQKRKVSSS